MSLIIPGQDRELSAAELHALIAGAVSAAERPIEIPFRALEAADGRSLSIVKDDQRQAFVLSLAEVPTRQGSGLVLP